MNRPGEHPAAAAASPSDQTPNAAMGAPARRHAIDDHK